MRCQHHLIPSFPSSVLSKAWPFHLFGRFSSCAWIEKKKVQDPQTFSAVTAHNNLYGFEPVARVMRLSFHVLMRVVAGEVKISWGGWTISETTLLSGLYGVQSMMYCVFRFQSDGFRHQKWLGTR